MGYWRSEAYKNNAKIHTKEQVAKIAASIKEHGLVNPPNVEPNGDIITGHGRHLALQQLGWEVVPTVVRYDLTKKEAAALRIADNKVAEGDMDTNILQNELRWLQKEDDTDLSVLGFDDKELEFLTADLGALDDDLLLGELELLESEDSSSDSDSTDTDDAIEEADKETVTLEKAFGFKKLTNAEARKLKRFMASISADESDPKKALLGHAEKVLYD